MAATRLSARAASRTLRSAYVCRISTSTTSHVRCLATVNNTTPHYPLHPPSAPQSHHNPRRFASSSGRSAADQIADRLQGMYAEVKDEFEIAVESTEANAVYAQSDRDATREELEKLKSAWKEALEMEEAVREDLAKRPIGQRIRELESAVEELERQGREDH